VCVGKLKSDAMITGEDIELYWSDLNQDFFDMTLFVGEGNIGI
jgi:8-oxo-dGTP diphosphatase